MDEQTLRKIINEEFKKLPTKDDLANFATKDDLKNFANKEDLKNLTTKNNLKTLQNHLEDFIADVLSSTDSSKAEKTDVEDLKQRVKRLEKEVLPN